MLADSAAPRPDGPRALVTGGKTAAGHPAEPRTRYSGGPSAVPFRDYNGKPDDASLDLLRAAGWRILAKDGGQEAVQTWPADTPSQEIDYVAERGLPAFTVEHRVIDEAVASDHRPILAVFRFSAANPAAGLKDDHQ